MSNREELNSLKEELKVKREEVRQIQAARKAQIESASQQNGMVVHKLSTVQKSMARQQKVLDDLVVQTDAELKKLQKDPPSSKRDHYMYLYEVRKQLLSRQSEFIKVLVAFNPDDKVSMMTFAQAQARLELTKVESKFLALEYTVVNYRPILKAIEAYLADDDDSKPATGPLPGRTGQTGQLPNAGAPKPGLAPRPGAPRPGGTAPLGQNRPTPGVNPAARPGVGPQATGSGPLGAQRPGTGSLAQRAGGTGPIGQGPRTGTGSLAGRSRTTLHPCYAALKAANLGSEQRRQLDVVVSQFKELDEAMAPLRSETPGQLGMPHIQANDLLAKLNGKKYYLNRALEGVGPVGQAIAFESDDTDPEFDMFLSAKNAVDADEPAADKQAGGIAGKLKSLFNLS